LDPSLYPQPYPVARLELYGFDKLVSYGERPPRIMLENGTYGREVTKCDHIKISGNYVIDHGHTMYYGRATDDFCYHSGAYEACYPHVELHPYHLNSIRLVEAPQPGDIVTETHTLVSPFYYQYYSHDFWNEVNEVEGRVVDDAKTNRISAEWFIPAPQSVNGCPGGCQLDITQNIIENTGGNNTISVTEESNGAHIRAETRVPYQVVTTTIPDLFGGDDRTVTFPLYLSDYKALPGPPNFNIRDPLRGDVPNHTI
jgi:hypothetical protein